MMGFVAAAVVAPVGALLSPEDALVVAVGHEVDLNTVKRWMGD